MKAKVIFPIGLILAVFLGGCEYPTTRVVVSGPPPPIAEVVTVSPGPGYYWARGHWAWRNGNYVWIRGHWVARGGTVWIDGHYENVGGSYVWIEGRWR